MLSGPDHAGAGAGRATNGNLFCPTQTQAKELEDELAELLAPLIGTTPNLHDMAGVVVQARDGGCIAAFGDEEEVCAAACGDRICVFQG